jgi:rRNA-processing protein FCF1
MNIEVTASENTCLLENFSTNKKRHKKEKHMKKCKEKRVMKRKWKEEKWNDRIDSLQEKLKHCEDSKEREKIQSKIHKIIQKNTEREMKRLKLSNEEQKQLEKKKFHKGEKKRRQEEREVRKQTNQQQDVNLEDEWPREIQNLYLDGNNMLFVPSYLRYLRLKRSKTIAEIVLSNLAREFSLRQQISHTHVMYDSTDITEMSDTFAVSSARPDFNTSDDKLVEIAKQANMNVTLDSYLFVTSDRELSVRLRQVGAKVIKPKYWFQFTFQIFNRDNEFESLDQMLENKFACK